MAQQHPELLSDLAIKKGRLGRDENLSSFTYGSYSSRAPSYWPPLLLLTDLYAQSVLTMGDDGFFSSSRTILTLNEFIPFSRTVFNIVLQGGPGENPGSNNHWTRSFLGGRTQQDNEVLASNPCTRLSSTVHARRPLACEFSIDMNLFIEAAVYEGQQADDPGIPRSSAPRQLAHSLSPRLGILSNIPFAIPFETRDGYDRLAEVDLRAPISITFIDQFGEPESGIDGGGVFKEFFTSLCKELFDTDRGLGLANKKNEIYPNPHAYATEGNLNWYRFIGRILGKALFEGILVEVAFPGFFLAKGLIFLKNHTRNTEDLSLNFTVATEEIGIVELTEYGPLNKVCFSKKKIPALAKRKVTYSGEIVIDGDQDDRTTIAYPRVAVTVNGSETKHYGHVISTLPITRNALRALDYGEAIKIAVLITSYAWTNVASCLGSLALKPEILTELVLRNLAEAHYGVNDSYDITIGTTTNMQWARSAISRLEISRPCMLHSTFRQPTVACTLRVRASVLVTVGWLVKAVYEYLKLTGQNEKLEKFKQLWGVNTEWTTIEPDHDLLDEHIALFQKASLAGIIQSDEGR
ncbi:hypothetical protein OG21DRAFT_1485369 [Imleria badia]|nr:hypothetical protein OG21DRAFT_1485369 [Imleria badia]